MDEIPRQLPPQGNFYTTIAVYAAANALSLSVFLILYHVSAVLADFRDAMLYAFLCSIALRGPKDWLVERMDWHLSQDRSLAVTVLSALLQPYFAVKMVWAEGKDLVRAFQSKLKEVRAEIQRKERGSKKLVASKQDGTQPNGASTPSSPRTPALLTSPLSQVQPYTLTVIAQAGYRTFTARKEKKKKKKGAASAGRKRATTPASNVILLSLVIATLAWLAAEWIWVSWSRAAQYRLVVGGVFAIAMFSLQSVIVKNFPGQQPGTPTRTPAQGGSTAGAARPQSPKSSRATAATPKIKQPVFGDTPQGPRAIDPGTGRARGILRTASQGFSHVGGVLSGGESLLRSLLRKNLHVLVTMVLIVGLLIGTAGTAAFLSARILNEARGVLVAAKDAFPAAWPGISAVTPLLVEELTDEDGNVELNMRGASRSLQQVASGVALPPWLEAYRQDAMALAQRSLPGMAAWLEGRVHGLMRAHNLTDTLWDARLLYEAAQGPRACSDRERSKLLVVLAKTEVTARHARKEETLSGARAADAQKVLSEAVTALSAALRRPPPPSQSCSGGSAGSTGTADGTITNEVSIEEGTAPHAPPPTCSTSTSTTCDTSSTNTAPKEESTEGGINTATDTLNVGGPSTGTSTGGPSLAELQERVVEADAVLSAAKEEHKITAAALDDAERARRVADSRLQLCIPAEADVSLPPSGNSTAQGLAAGLGTRLGSAFDKLIWQWHFREGFAELQGAMKYAMNSITQRPGSSAAADLTKIQRLVQVAAGPLFGIGRAAAASVGTTTAAAVMGSLGLFRLGLGVVHLGVQAALFLTLLYYLLAAETDPLTRAVALMPLPPVARDRAAASLNAALGGVFMSMLKLASFHGLFAWLTFRVAGAPLAYTSAVASAAFALLPFVPTYAVAIPGCAVMALQGKVAAAVILLLAHFGAYNIGDAKVLEDSGGHPFMMSLAILGGLWAFSNPLLGCLLGPTLLSLLGALGQLHTELMGGSTAGGGPALFLSPTGAGLPRRPLALNLTTPEGQGRSLGGELRQGGASPGVSPRHPISAPQSPNAGSCTSREASPRGRGGGVAGGAAISASMSMSMDELPKGGTAGTAERDEMTSGVSRGDNLDFSFPKSPSKRRDKREF